MLGKTGWGRLLSLTVLGNLMFLGNAVQAELIVAYTSTSSSGALEASQFVAGLEPLPLSRGPGLSVASGSTFNSRSWTTADTIAAADYLEWGWVRSATPVDLVKMDIRYDRSASGPQQLAIHLAVDGGPFQAVFEDSAVSVAGEDQAGIDLTAFTSVQAATFRLFGFAADSGVGTLDLENIGTHAITVEGNTAVPEPGTTLLVSLGAGIAAVHRLRRRRCGRGAAGPDKP